MAQGPEKSFDDEELAQEKRGEKITVPFARDEWNFIRQCLKRTDIPISQLFADALAYYKVYLKEIVLKDYRLFSALNEHGDAIFVNYGPSAFEASTEIDEEPHYVDVFLNGDSQRYLTTLFDLNDNSNPDEIIRKAFMSYLWYLDQQNKHKKLFVLKPNGDVSVVTLQQR